MCGATSEQKNLEASQSRFYDTMTAQYNQVFGKQQAILDALTSVFKPILEAGPDQHGFGDAERTALETNATERVAGNYKMARQSLEENMAARGGTDFVPAGADEQIREEMASGAANEEAGLKNQITQADFGEGRRVWQVAANSLGGVAAELNPVGFANATTGAGTAAADTANQIAQADNSFWSGVMGAVGGVAGQAVGGWTSTLGKKKGT